MTLPAVQVKQLLSYLDKKWTNCPKLQGDGQLNWRSHLHTISHYWLITWTTEASRGEYSLWQRQHAWVPVRKPRGCVKAPGKVFVTHSEAHFFPRQQAFPLLQSATGTHTQTTMRKKCLWCRNVMQIDLLVNLENAAFVAKVVFKKEKKGK